MLVNEFIGVNIATQAGDAAYSRSFGDRLLLQLARMRFQLTGGFMMAVIAPALVANRFNLRTALNLSDPAFVGTLWAFLIGYLVFRKLTAYPGVRATAFILPAFVSSYAIVTSLILLLRLQYSTVQFVLSLLFSSTFFYAVFFMVRRARMTELSVIPVGDFMRLFSLRHVTWRLISSPEAGMDLAAPIVVDLRTDLSPEWERFVTDSALAGRPIYSAKQVFESLSGRVLVEHLSENTFGSLIPNSIYASAKRQCDS